MNHIQNIINKVNEFPTLPTIYVALSEVMANPRSTINDAAEILSKDQAATAKILKVANSSLFGLRVNIDTITKAIFYLGFDEVKNLVSAMKIINLFSSNGNSSVSAVDLWKHSIAVGVINRNLGALMAIKNLENYFIAGILHDIGKLFFYKYYYDEYQKVIDYAITNNIEIRESEQSILGITHTMVGQLLAEKWKLPRSLINAISFHNTGLVNGRVEFLVATLHLANIIALALELGVSFEEIIPQPNVLIWEKLNFPEGAIKNAIPKIMQDFNDSVEILLTN